MYRPHCLALAAGTALVTLLARGTAHANVIFTDFGPGDSYDTSNNLVVMGPTSSFNYGGPVGFRQDIAGHFKTDGNSYNSLTFEGAFTYWDASNGLIFELHNDSGGVPGTTLLDTSSVTNAVGYPGSILTWTLNPSTTLAANTDYWISARASGSDGFLSWSFNNQGAVGVSLSGDGANWSPAPHDPAPAFRVSGQVYSNTAPVPEPGAWASMGMMGFCTLGLIVRKRRKP